jgi:hypothetical protein
MLIAGLGRNSSEESRADGRKRLKDGRHLKQSFLGIFDWFLLGFRSEDTLLLGLYAQKWREVIDSKSSGKSSVLEIIVSSP